MFLFNFDVEVISFLQPSYDPRLSFVGYDGIVERLVVLSSGNENSSVVIEVLSYFWHSAR